jgi:hypothetical protein
LVVVPQFLAFKALQKIGQGGIAGTPRRFMAAEAAGFEPHDHGFAAPRLTCAPELARGVAGHRVASHAGFAHVNTLVQLPCIIARVTLGDARTLLFGGFHFLRTRAKAEGQHCQGNEASPLHGTPSKGSLSNVPGLPRPGSGQAVQLISVSQSYDFCQIVFKINARD